MTKRLFLALAVAAWIVAAAGVGAVRAAVTVDSSAFTTDRTTTAGKTYPGTWTAAANGSAGGFVTFGAAGHTNQTYQAAIGQQIEVTLAIRNGSFIFCTYSSATAHEGCEGVSSGAVGSTWTTKVVTYTLGSGSNQWTWFGLYMAAGTEYDTLSIVNLSAASPTPTPGPTGTPVPSEEPEPEPSGVQDVRLVGWSDAVHELLDLQLMIVVGFGVTLTALVAVAALTLATRRGT